MYRLLIAASACTVFAAGACQKSPTERQAEALSDSGRSRASVVREGAKSEADALDQRASTLTAKAKTVGGYTGERLAVQAHAAADEASIVRKQGRAQAQSIEEAGDAEAKAVRSR